MNLHDTLTAKTKELTTTDGSIKMYVCGITPYAAAHIGHAMRSVVFDVLRRYLEYKGFDVKYVENFTDIDDKMIASANDMGITVQDLAEKNIAAYLEEMDALNVKRADIYPRATEEIPKIQEIIGGLIDKDYAYAVQGDVYYKVRKKKDYGKLGHRTLDTMRVGARIEPGELKNMVSAIRNIEKAMGDGEKKPSPSEIKNLPIARKSIVAKKSIKKGEQFSGKNLTVKRPGTGISPMNWDIILGKKANRDYEPDELIEYKLNGD